MTAVFRTSRRVEFRDTDAAGIAHFSSFFFYMEQAEHDLLRHIGLSVLWQEGDHWISWPRVRAECDYLGPARFEDELEIEVIVERLGEKSVTFAFQFRHQGRIAARGSLVTVCCRILPEQPPQSIPIPAWIAEKLSVYHRAAEV